MALPSRPSAPQHLGTALVLGLACTPSGSDTTTGLSVPDTWAGSSTGSSSDAFTTDLSATASASSTASSATTSASTDDSSPTTDATTLIYDVGPDTTDSDTADTKPPGCKGKIDFLFVISRAWTMKSAQEQLITAFPKFIETIEAKFADFDFHIMVIDGDHEWGLESCDVACAQQESCVVSGYPCDLLHLVTTCDRTIGAGNVFAAGGQATNTPCTIAGGRRYLTKEQPNLAETFACIAKLGISGRDLMGEALTMAMKPEINAPGGCNAGFLRDDALLMVTFIGGYDYNSKWDPGTWSANVLKAKKDDAEAVVMLSILDPTCPAPDRICQLVKKYPYHLVADLDLDYTAPFEQATDLIEVACAEYIPG
ncbi:MAG: hypothetical protein IPK80_01575 [Nannocystis sp.]|nr:hypothetical protein [Nannocystis sp.]